MYVLAVAAENTGVLLHAVCVLSNHWHAVITDPEGRLPEFMCHVNEFVAKAVNSSLGRWENLFATEQPSAVRLERPEDVIGKMLYTLLNPVESCLVKREEKWPGLWRFEGEQCSGAVLNGLAGPELTLVRDGAAVLNVLAGPELTLVRDGL